MRRRDTIRTMIRHAVAGVMLAGGLLAACTEVDLCYAPHPHRAYLDFRYHWPEEYAGLRPDSMGVVAVRPVNLFRYEYRTTALEEGNTGVMLSPGSERQPLADAAGPTGNDALWARSGEYNFAAFAWDAATLDEETELQDAAGDPTDMGSGLTPLYLSYRHYPVDAPEITGYFGEWRDYNAYSDYISGVGMPVYFARADRVEVPVADSANVHVPVDFHISTLTQAVTFRLHVEKEEGVVVDSLCAEIAGVPATIELTTGLIRARRTYKMLFRPAYGPLASAADSTAATRLECAGTVHVTGIVRSYSEEMVTGPGILQIAVYAHYDYTDEGTGQPRRAVKVFHAGINLYHTLKERELLDYDDTLDGYYQTCRTAEIEILSPLVIDREGVAGSGSAATGLDAWMPGETIEVRL